MNDSDNNRLGAVIVTYNRLTLLKEAISCIEMQEYPFSKVVIVNNCSTDGTKEYLEALDTEKYIVENMSENLGGAGGFSVGIQKMLNYDMDWVLIIDDDAMLAKDYTKQIIDFAKKKKNVQACAGIVKTNDKITTVHRRRMSNKWLFIETEVKEDEYQKEYFHCDLATFCGLMIRGEAMKKIGVPNADYFIWYDDTEYCLRLKEFGGIYNVNAAILNHKTKETKLEGNYFSRTNWKYYYGQRNRLDTARKHYGGLTTILVYLEMIAFLLMAVFLLLFGKDKTKAKYNVKMLKNACKDAFHHSLGKNINYIP